MWTSDMPAMVVSTAILADSSIYFYTIGLVHKPMARQVVYSLAIMTSSATSNDAKSSGGSLSSLEVCKRYFSYSSTQFTADR